MMKNFVSAFLCVFLLFSAAGCSKQNAANTRAQDWGYFYFPDTDWGMTEDELFTALNAEKEDFAFGELPGGLRCFQIERDVLGDKVKTRFDFTAALTSDVPRLSGVQWQYQSDFTAEKCEAVKEKLVKLFEEQGAEIIDDWSASPLTDGEENAGTVYNIKSKKRLIDLPQKIQDEYNKNIKVLYDSGKYDFPDLGGAEKIDFVKAQDSAMSSASITIFNDGSGFAAINGNAVVQALEYSQKK